eukprot:gnl/Carplike_NY0171/5177_a7065_277.p1 GENE.gnl/Carplike_NY0171/5177_a7065_277~~gnl/Carplike_NY0171/5177_a7065_277.p1  ORF type:complete len:605 (-),score=133.97 gnl/Carplike_NY0171/5177_a7065_277:21-1835(-)
MGEHCAVSNLLELLGKPSCDLSTIPFVSSQAVPVLPIELVRIARECGCSVLELWRLSHVLFQSGLSSSSGFMLSPLFHDVVSNISRIISNLSSENHPHVTDSFISRAVINTLIRSACWKQGSCEMWELVARAKTIPPSRIAHAYSHLLKESWMCGFTAVMRGHVMKCEKERYVDGQIDDGQGADFDVISTPTLGPIPFDLSASAGKATPLGRPHALSLRDDPSIFRALITPSIDDVIQAYIHRAEMCGNAEVCKPDPSSVPLSTSGLSDKISESYVLLSRLFPFAFNSFYSFKERYGTFADSLSPRMWLLGLSVGETMQVSCGSSHVFPNPFSSEVFNSWVQTRGDKDPEEFVVDDDDDVYRETKTKKHSAHHGVHSRRSASRRSVPRRASSSLLSSTQPNPSTVTPASITLVSVVPDGKGGIICNYNISTIPWAIVAVHVENNTHIQNDSDKFGRIMQTCMLNGTGQHSHGMFNKPLFVKVNDHVSTALLSGIHSSAEPADIQHGVSYACRKLPELESFSCHIPIFSNCTGNVCRVNVSVGDVVSVGTVIMSIEDSRRSIEPLVATHTGVVTSVLKKMGESIGKGEIVCGIVEIFDDMTFCQE